MADFPIKSAKQLSGIYTSVDGIYTLKDQQRLKSGNDWPPVGATPVTSYDFEDTNTYTFSGSQSAATNLSANISLGNVADFDLEVDIYSTNTSSSNSWVVQNNEYNVTGGFLFGLYSAHKAAIAGSGIGGYGYYTANEVAFNTWVTIKFEIRLSSGAITGYIDGTNNGTTTGFSATYINLDYLYVGAGRPNTSQSWSNPFAGFVKNIRITLV